MYTRRWLLIAGILAAGLVSAQDAQTIQIAGDVKQPLTLSADDLAKMPRATVKTMSNGMENVYEGVWLHEVLKRAGVPQGEALRGKALGKLRAGLRAGRISSHLLAGRIGPRVHRQ